MEKTDIKIRAIEAAVFLAGCCVSLFFVLGFDFKPAPNKSAAMFSATVALVETLKILLFGKRLRILFFFLDPFIAYWIGVVGIALGGGVVDMKDTLVMSVEFYPLLLLLTLAVTSVGYALLLVRFFLEKKR